MTRLRSLKRRRRPIVPPAAPPIEPPAERNLADPSTFRTPLGRRLAELRAAIIAAGVPLLDTEGLRRELAARGSGYIAADEPDLH